MSVYQTSSTRRSIRRRVRRVAIFLFIAGLVAGGGYGVVRMKLFTIQTVSVHGNIYTERAEILPVRPPFLYFRNPTVAGATIATATIEKHFFQKHMDIHVEERERYGVWCAADCVWFDRTGIAFAPAVRTTGDIIKSVHESSNAKIAIGGRVLDQRFLPNLIAIFDILEEQGIRFAEARLDHRENQEITILTTAGIPLYFSLRTDPAFATEALRKLKPEFSRLQYIDFRSQNRVFFEYTDGASPN
jgi:hypothetical protein